MPPFAQIPLPLNDKEDLTTLVFPNAPPSPCGIALVFGTPHYTTYFADQIIRLWQKGTAPFFIFSGYNGEAEKLAAASRQAGLPQTAYALETKASNTRENILFSQDLIKQHAQGEKTLLAVTRLHAARRAQMTLLRTMPDWQINISPVNSFDVSKTNWLESTPFIERVIGEIKRIPVYLEKGHLALPPDMPLTPERIRALGDRLEKYYLEKLAPPNASPLDRKLTL